MTAARAKAKRPAPYLVVLPHGKADCLAVFAEHRTAHDAVRQRDALRRFGLSANVLELR